MSAIESNAESTPRRRLSFQSVDDVAAELKRLRRVPLRQRGTWTLPQACRHLATVIEGSLTPPESDIPTPEEIAKREGFFKIVFSPEGMPVGMPAGATAPPPDCSEPDFDRLLTAFQKLTAYPHDYVKVGGCGPVAIADVVRLHLAHSAHHFSFQEPTVQPRADLRYIDAAAAIADVQLLRKGHIQLGNWTLAQMCWHMGTIVKFLMQAPQGDTPPTTPEQRAMLDTVLTSGKIRKGIDAPPQVLPPESAGEEAIDLFIRQMNLVETYNGSWMPHRLFGGSLTPEEYRQLCLIHAAHHLANLIPTSAG